MRLLFLLGLTLALANQYACQKTPSTSSTNLSVPNPEPIRILRDWQGSQCGVSQARQLVVRDPGEWKTIWKQMAATREPEPPAPEIDFEKEMVVGVFLGEKPTGGYTVRITRLRSIPEGVEVQVRETSPPPGSLVAQVLTQPYHLVTVERKEGRVKFVPSE